METLSKELDNIIESFKNCYSNIDESLTKIRISDDKKK